MANLSWTVSVQVSGGPTISASRQSKPLEAYDRIDVVVDPGTTTGTPKEVEIQPGTASRVTLILIKSSLYAPELTFKASDGTTDSDAVKVDEPQLFAGGAVELFGVDPKSLKFSNTTDKPAAVEIFVGRDATP